jgi:hypothetical protein
MKLEIRSDVCTFEKWELLIYLRVFHTEYKDYFTSSVLERPV